MIYWVNQYLMPLNQPGATRHVEFARRLVARGHPVTLVGADFNHRSMRYTARSGTCDRGVKSEWVGDLRLDWLYTAPYTQNDRRRAWSMLRFGLATAAYLARRLRKGDVVIGSSPHLFTPLGCLPAATLRRARFIFEVRDLWPESLVEVLGRETVVTRALAPAAYALYRLADKVIVLARGTGRVLAERGVSADKLVYIPNSVDPALFDEAKPASRRELGLPEQGLLAVYAGAHGPANHLETLIDAAALVGGKLGGRAPVHVVLLGDGPTKPALKARAAERGVSNVAFLDPIPKRDIPSLLKACDVGLMHLKDVPLFRYGVSPNKLFDYMAAGLVVLDTVQGECRQIVESADCGVVVPPENPEAVADALQGLVDRVAERRAMGRRGRQYVGEHFNRNVLVERLIEAVEGT